MKSIAVFLLSAAAGTAAVASDLKAPAPGDSIQVERVRFGSGTPAPVSVAGKDTAAFVADGLYHVPGFMPGYPTAATIWPRELPLECVSNPVDGTPACGGYRVLPAVGRGEYIFVRPVEKELPAPVVSNPAPVQVRPVAPAKKPLG